MAKKQRLDTLLVELGISENRSKASALILAGSVLVNNVKISKSGTQVSPDADVRLINAPTSYVSRGGLKLEGALQDLNIKVDGKVALDIGASTGGFTDALLKHGAKKIYAFDVGYGQFDWKLRNDPRVTLYERINARYLKPSDIPEQADLAVIDVSFISLKLVLPAIVPLLHDTGEILALIKPQFELSKSEIGKGGVVKDSEKHEKAILSVSEFVEGMNMTILGKTQSKHPGPKGNIEFFIYASKVRPGSGG
jgi:23S rRNA (cytidine1920-2'-O)/16S rRNA (cytidine1409-2'-O)-methyltransferase